MEYILFASMLFSYVDPSTLDILIVLRRFRAVVDVDYCIYVHTSYHRGDGTRRCVAWFEYRIEDNGTLGSTAEILTVNSQTYMTRTSLNRKRWRLCCAMSPRSLAQRTAIGHAPIAAQNSSTNVTNVKIISQVGLALC